MSRVGRYAAHSYFILHIFYLVTLSGVLVALAPCVARAQEGLSVTVTPPLYQLSIGPGESWTSSLKIVNRNSFDVTYHAHVVEMEASGEGGQSKFTPLLGEGDPMLANAQLARWIELKETQVTIKAGQSANLHFTVDIPQSAEPGGHYAAILVGTQPFEDVSVGSGSRIASFVSSLLFVRVQGDVQESGRIREFTSDQALYQTPSANFALRFENLGNTHVKPQGDVSIYNMWGKLRGQLSINTEAGFGNVLPKTVRRFEFTWEGEESVFDIGRYSAVVTLAYGEDGRKNISATTYFWVVPVIPVSVALGSILFFLLLLGWFIRRYVRRALALERERFGVPSQGFPVVAETSEIPVTAMKLMMEPIRESVVDLRKMRGTAHSNGETGTLFPQEASGETRLSLGEFFMKYKLFFAFILVVVCVAAGLWVYFGKVLVPERDYSIKTSNAEAETP